VALAVAAAAALAAALVAVEAAAAEAVAAAKGREEELSKRLGAALEAAAVARETPVGRVLAALEADAAGPGGRNCKLELFGTSQKRVLRFSRYMYFHVATQKGSGCWRRHPLATARLETDERRLSLIFIACVSSSDSPVDLHIFDLAYFDLTEKVTARHR
jgi:hypothetical protein